MGELTSSPIQGSGFLPPATMSAPISEISAQGSTQPAGPVPYFLSCPSGGTLSHHTHCLPLPLESLGHTRAVPRPLLQPPGLPPSFTLPALTPQVLLGCPQLLCLEEEMFLCLLPPFPKHGPEQVLTACVRAALGLIFLNLKNIKCIRGHR